MVENCLDLKFFHDFYESLTKEISLLCGDEKYKELLPLRPRRHHQLKGFLRLPGKQDNIKIKSWLQKGLERIGSPQGPRVTAETEVLTVVCLIKA